jgi:hypothetical protein
MLAIGEQSINHSAIRRGVEESHAAVCLIKMEETINELGSARR